MNRSRATWRDQAACVDTCADEWFPDPHARVNPLLFRICGDCPVWRDCLLFTLTHPDTFHGVWAGLTAAEITTLRQRLLTRELGTDIIDAARAISRNRDGGAVYAGAVPDPVPGYDQLREQRRQVEARLRAVGLLDRDEHHGRAA